MYSYIDDTLDGEIRVPTLAVAGALDPSCHPYVAWYERTIPGCQGVIVPGAGLDVWEEEEARRQPRSI